MAANSLPIQPPNPLLPISRFMYAYTRYPEAFAIDALPTTRAVPNRWMKSWTNLSLTAYKRKEKESFDVLFPHAKTPAKTDSTSGSIIGRCREKYVPRIQSYRVRSNSWTQQGLEYLSSKLHTLMARQKQQPFDFGTLSINSRPPYKFELATRERDHWNGNSACASHSLFWSGPPDLPNKRFNNKSRHAYPAAAVSRALAITNIAAPRSFPHAINKIIQPTYDPTVFFFGSTRELEQLDLATPSLTHYTLLARYKANPSGSRYYSNFGIPRTAINHEKYKRKCARISTQNAHTINAANCSIAAPYSTTTRPRAREQGGAHERRAIARAYQCCKTPARAPRGLGAARARAPRTVACYLGVTVSRRASRGEEREEEERGERDHVWREASARMEWLESRYMRFEESRRRRAVAVHAMMRVVVLDLAVVWRKLKVGFKIDGEPLKGSAGREYTT
ncbi:hypothetical protein B0H17DRAFT_1231852 [Mycena rosella]|uniref:Uncharacterized protein n=1 Tax=Mycena rosella TaxID=1033263 RepID=A0AAD7GDD8_MYCRO|nr:hypothetical protein B0H17DRAFT_1231852 [Mycena rosella]